MEAQATAPAAPVELPDEISLDDARAIMNSWDDPDKHMKFEGDPPPEEARPPKAEEAEDAPPQPDTSEQETEEEAPEETRTRDLPRSWTKEQAENWNKLDPAIQDYLLEQDSKASKAIRQSQNEAAEARKAAEAELAKAEQARKDYEQKLPDLVKTIETTLQNEFGDIQNIADVRKLQAEDPFRFQQWQIKQMELSAAQAAGQEAAKQQAAQAETAWQTHVQSESKKFEESLSDSDKGKLKDYMNEAPKFLGDKGFSQKELNDLAAGKEKLSLYDSRVQSLILDGLKYQAIQNAPKAVATKPVATVQKPGSPRVASIDADIQALTRRLDESGSEADAWELLQAKMRKDSRR